MFVHSIFFVDALSDILFSPEFGNVTSFGVHCKERAGFALLCFV